MINKLKTQFSGDKNLKELLLGSLTTLILKLGGMLLGFVVIYLISEKTGAKGVGFYNYSLTFLTLAAMILSLGMTNSILRFIGQYNNENDRHNINVVHKYMLQFITPISIFAGVLLWFFADDLVHYLNKDQNYELMFKLSGIILPVFTINQLHIEFVRGLKKLKYSEFLRNVIRPLLMIVGLLVYYNASLEIMDVIYIFYAAIVVSTLIGALIVINNRQVVTKTISRVQRKDIVKTSLPMMISGISSNLLSAMPVFFLDYYISQESVGVFSVAFRIASLVSLSLAIVNTFAAPKIAELYWSKQNEQLQKLIKQSSQIMFWSAFVTSVILILGANFWLGIFGEEFKNGRIVLILMAIGQLINASTGSVGVLMNMSGKQKMLQYILLFTAIILFLCYLFFVPSTGLIGAGIISMLGAIAVNLSLVIYVKKNMGFNTYYLPYIK